MINLLDLYETMMYGELAALEWSDPSVGTIDEASKKRFISYVNAATKVLYVRYPIRQEEFIVQQYENIDLYEMNEKYAVTNTGSSEPIKYINDTPSLPFLNASLIRIDAVNDEEGNELPINDSSKESSLFIPKYNTVQVPEPIANKVMGVVCRWMPSLIQYTPSPVMDFSTVFVDIPIYFEEALKNYIAYKAYLHRPSLDGADEAGKYLQLYEIACRKVIDYGMLHTEESSKDIIKENRWE